MKALVVGAGGLGGPIAMALAAAGVEHLRVCDPDAVELSNLHRQIQFSGADLGAPKAERLAARLAARGAAGVEARAERFEAATAAALLAGVDVAIDGSDNFATKFAVNDEALARGIPAVIAAAVGWRGQVLLARPGAGCYRCLFEEPPENDNGGCAQVGVIGAACGVIAGEAAAMALAVLAGEPTQQLIVHDHVAGAAPRRIHFSPRPGCPACAAAQLFLEAS